MLYTLPEAIQKLLWNGEIFPRQRHRIDVYHKGPKQYIVWGKNCFPKNDNAAHACIISSRQPDDIKCPNWCIHGSYPVDGCSRDWSSTGGKIQVETALKIISELTLVCNKDLPSPLHKTGFKGIKSMKLGKSITMDLKNMKLSTDEVNNVWCDKVTGTTHLLGSSHSDPPVLPAEKWAIYSNYPE
jgi:hypothetical protein